MKLGVILGSIRQPSNTAGVAHWLVSSLSKRDASVVFETINLGTSTDHPLPLDIDPVIPAGHPKNDGPESLAGSYAHPMVQAWSRKVSGFDAVIFVTPQYNWGVPAPLKNAIDQLFFEWNEKPVGIVTIGGHGGTKACASLRAIMDGGVHARVAPTVVNITLPENYVRSRDRLHGDETMLLKYDEVLRRMAVELGV